MKNLNYVTQPERRNNPKLADEFRIRPLKQWIAGLPIANYGLTIRMFHDHVVEMNGVELETEVLLQAAEELYPIYRMAEDFLLARLVGKSYPLTSDEQKIGQLAETVTKDYITGYARILRDVSSASAGWRLARSFPRVVCRLVRGLSRILLLRYLLRLPEPEWLWRDLHGLYLLAKQKDKHDAKIKETDDGTTVTIETMYKQIVLLRLADPWGLGHREILDLYQRFEEWSEVLELSPADPAAKMSGCILYLDEDKPPSLAEERDSEVDPDFRVYTMALDKLFQRLSGFLAAADRSVGRFDLVDAEGKRARGEPAALLEYLFDRWSGTGRPRHHLFEDRKPRILSIGLKATHQQLNPPTNSEEKMISDWLVTVSEDESLRCEFDQPGQIYLGSLVSMKVVELENARRVLGVVDRLWMNSLNGAVHFQIAVLSPHVLAAGVQPVSGKKEMQVYQRTLLFFTEKGASQKANLILESQKLKNGNMLQLLTHGETVRIRLEHRENVAPGYWRFECVPLAEDKKEALPLKGYDFL